MIQNVLRTLGGIANYGTLTVTRSALLHNRAGVLGGGVANFGSATITDSRFISNTADGRGGALYSDSGLLVITRSLFMSISTIFRPKPFPWA